jgi:hypothetical protein
MCYLSSPLSSFLFLFLLVMIGYFIWRCNNTLVDQTLREYELLHHAEPRL